MNHNNPKLLLITISILFYYCELQAQVIDYRVTYNNSSSMYEVYGRATANLSNINVAGSQLSVVIPAAAPNTAFTVTSNVGGTWSDAIATYAPAAQPGSDFHSFFPSGGVFSMTANTEVLFFSFSIGASCVAGARMYINGVDPGPFDPGMGGFDYSNILFDPFSLTDYTGVPYSNGGSSCSILPLTLLSFNGSKTSSGVLLQWTTSNEVNTASFDIERSANGIDYSIIGNILSKESAAIRNNSYRYTDNTAAGSNTYYRLKMRDRDEQYTYSSIVIVKNEITAGSSFHVYPNPVNGSYLYIQQVAGLHAAITVKIVDLAGSIWINRQLTADKLQNDRFVIPVNQLPAGNYVLQIIDGKGMLQVVKFRR